MNKAVLFFILLLWIEASSAQTQTILLSEDRRAEAICVPINKRLSNCFIKVEGVDMELSNIEEANLGKLGIRNRTEYEKITSFPSKWLMSEGNEFMVEITTQAWIEGQRHTVKEPAYIRNGKYIAR